VKIKNARALAAALACFAPLAAIADSDSADAAKEGRFEFKRQNTGRGTPSETTQTTLRIERYFDGPVTMFRLDLPFPDNKTDFGGSPFDPRPGDFKTRFRFKPFRSDALSFTPFVEFTFPTANPESLGKGKYQTSEGVRIVAPAHLSFLDASSHKPSLEIELQQINSFAGDPAFKDVNNTKVEIALYDLFRQKYTFKAKLKTYADWAENGNTGAVAEVEGGSYFARDWRAWLMLGCRAWGPSNIANTYQKRVELNLAYTY